MQISELKKLLKEIKDITFSKHFYEPKVVLRGLSEEEVKNYLRSPEKLIVIEDQGKEPLGHRYAILFSKSNKYDLKIVISIKGKGLKVITAHVQNIKRRKVVEKWLRKLK